MKKLMQTFFLCIGITLTSFAQNQPIEIQLAALEETKLLTDIVELNTECTVQKFSMIFLEKYGDTPVQVWNNGNEFSTTGLKFIRNAQKGSVLYFEEIKLLEECEERTNVPSHFLVSVN